MIINFRNLMCSGGGIPEAPIDGKIYGRKDGNWTNVESHQTFTIYVPTFIQDLNSGQPIVAQDINPQQKEHNTSEVQKLGPVIANPENKTKDIVHFLGLAGEKERLNVIRYDANGAVLEVEMIQKDFAGKMLWVKAQLNPNGWQPMLIKQITISSDLANFIGDAPVDGKQYARQDGNWTEVQAGGGGIDEAPQNGIPYVRQNATWIEGVAYPIEVVVPFFNLNVTPITIQYDITPEDKTANMASAEKINEIIASGKMPNVIIRDNRKQGYYTPWKVTSFQGKATFIAMQEMYGRKNEIVGYNIESDGSITAFTDWKGADARDFGTQTLDLTAVAGTSQAAENIRILSLRPRPDVTATIARVEDPETGFPTFCSMDEYNKNGNFIIISLRGKQVKYNFDKATGVFTKADDLSYTKTEIDNLIGTANNKLETI